MSGDNSTYSEIVDICQNVTILANRALSTLCHSYLKQHDSHVRTSSTTTLGSHRPSPTLVWGFGLFFVTLISLCALVGIGFMRLLNKNTFKRFITFFVSVGVGSLCGSAVFHLLPQVRINNLYMIDVYF
jgi:zinc transporter 14